MERNTQFTVILAAVAIVALSAFLLVYPYPGGDADYRPGPPAAVDSIEILILESFPVQVNVVAKGSLPSSCYKLGRTETARTIEGNFDVNIGTDVMDAACAQAIVPFEHVISLPVRDLPKGVYNVTVNGIPDSFELQMDNFISQDWRNDGIELRQHETEGYYGCFGCSAATDGPALCIDPAIEMKPVEETEERHCSSDFEVVEQ
jgi:inhibitor of cysteine peptidase